MSRYFVVLRASRHVQAGVVVVASFVAVSCDSRPEWTYPLNIDYGDTCGYWERDPSDYHRRERVCPSDALCQYMVDAFEFSNGPFGICTARYKYDVCDDGWRISSVTGLERCLKSCTTTADCPQPFQICSEGVCAIVDCANESDVPMRDPACESRLSPDDHANILCDQHLCVLQNGSK